MLIALNGRFRAWTIGDVNTVLGMSNAALNTLSGEVQSGFGCPFDEDSSDSSDGASIKTALMLYLRGNQVGLRDAKRLNRKVLSR